MTGFSVGWLPVALLFAACVGCGQTVRSVAPVGANDVIVAFGDSLTYGTGATESESYPAALAELIGRKVVRAGVPGEVTEGGLQRLPAVIEEHRPALVIVCLGGNDMLRKLDEAQTKANLREIINTIRAGGISAAKLFPLRKPPAGRSHDWQSPRAVLVLPGAAVGIARATATGISPLQYRQRFRSVAAA